MIVLKISTIVQRKNMLLVIDNDNDNGNENENENENDNRKYLIS